MQSHREVFIFLFFILLTFNCQKVSAQDSSKIARIPAIYGTKKESADLKKQITFITKNEKEEVFEEDFNQSSQEKLQGKIREFNYSFLNRKSTENEPIFDKIKEKEFTEKDFSSGDVRRIDFEKAWTDKTDTIGREGFNWRGAIEQSLFFLGVQHGYAILGQQKTRDALKGKFWKDYKDSVKSLHGWDDGGRFFTNYIAHPLQGAFTGFIYIQNSPQARREQFSMTGKYWKTRMKAMLWTTAWSTQFEIGPISQASIGNVGLKGKQTWEDIVVTPTLGTAFLVGEDFFDRYVIKGIERRTDNFYIRIFARMIFNPSRNFSNMLRFKTPWYRDRPVAD